MCCKVFLLDITKFYHDVNDDRSAEKNDFNV